MTTDWVTVYCPVCKKLLGQKDRSSLTSFTCQEEGCSKTKHFFYPGDTKKPRRSMPQYQYYHDKKQCGKPCCEDT